MRCCFYLDVFRLTTAVFFRSVIWRCWCVFISLSAGWLTRTLKEKEEHKNLKLAMPTTAKEIITLCTGTMWGSLDRTKHQIKEAIKIWKWAEDTRNRDEGAFMHTWDSPPETGVRVRSVRPTPPTTKNSWYRHVSNIGWCFWRRLQLKHVKVKTSPTWCLIKRKWFNQKHLRISQ